MKPKRQQRRNQSTSARSVVRVLRQAARRRADGDRSSLVLGRLHQSSSSWRRGSQVHEAGGSSEATTSRRRCRLGLLQRRRRLRHGLGRTQRPELLLGSPRSRPSTRSTSSALALK